jgi:ABC-type dipeptide/oligopeptide/nickel transport system ATPase component
MNKIVNLRGTSGSGKTSVAKTFLDHLPNTPLKDATGKVKGYHVDATAAGIAAPLFILGRYDTACGGCDTIATQQEAADLAVKAWSSGGHVLMEGLLASAVGIKGAIPATLEPTGAAVYAILDTPLHVCLERVKKRRDDRGETKPFNPANTEAKYKQVHRAKVLLENEKCDVRMIDHTNAFKEVLAIYREAETV